ncbi:multiple monosaccharide ABC transporter permease [Nesterenkonia flava]|uniref:Xylose transport system permease protein XylH n=1 Tax=Nesterenkonia flava TaxID=469799 RepID=A0ABU1FS93_9MICC|nr:multiple monosaccharide ABC transporter permease [Nesterenkonia flava]MDR5711535.1 sugar ABC transporter permease [Nesterenkonia flava]
MTTAVKEESSSGSRRLRIKIDARQYGILIALVAIVLFFQILTEGRLLIPANVSNLIQQNAYVLILAIGMVFVIVSGHIDLSVGSVVAMVGAITAIASVNWGWSWYAAVLLALVVGALVGAWQGFWVAYIGIPAFIVTLAGMLLFRGITLVLLSGGTINALPQGLVSIGQGMLPQPFGLLFDGRDGLTLLIAVVVVGAIVLAAQRSRHRKQRLALPVEKMPVFVLRLAVTGIGILLFAWLLSGHRGLPIILIILSALILLYTFVLRNTVFGRQVYAVGGNRHAAMMSGVRTRRVDFLVFVNMGTLAALAGVVTASRAGGAVASAGYMYELDAIAAVFIGGAAITGGVGTVIGAVIGALIMGVLNMGLSILSVDSAWQQVVKGMVLLLAVGFDVWNKRRQRQT